MSLSRRAFFQSIIPRVKSPQKAPAEDPEFSLGHIGVFPVDTETRIKLGDRELLVKALPEGVQLIDLSSGTHIRLCLGDRGHIVARMAEVWPPNAVLSLFSGEIYLL